MAKKTTKAQKKGAKKAASSRKKAAVKKKAPARQPAAKKTATKKVAVKKKVAAKSTPKKPAKAPATKPAKKEPAKVAKPATKAAPPPAKKPAAPAPVRKVEAESAPKPGATKEPPPPIKVEPRLIETPEPVRVQEIPQGDLFTKEELEKFRKLLRDERDKILEKAKRAVAEGNINFSKDDMYDEVDQASAMEAQNLNLRLLDRDRKLLAEIEHALSKIDSGEYGYCEGTGEPIPKRRLELRPWTRHSVKYKEKLERMKKSGRGVVDEDEF